jgi:hypothetical protein
MTSLPPSCADCLEIWSLNHLEPSGPVQACTGIKLSLSRLFFMQLFATLPLDLSLRLRLPDARGRDWILFCSSLQEDHKHEVYIFLETNQTHSNPQRPHSWLRHGWGNGVLVSKRITYIYIYIYTRNNCNLLYKNKITVLRELVSPPWVASLSSRASCCDPLVKQSMAPVSPPPPL